MRNNLSIVKFSELKKEKRSKSKKINHEEDRECMAFSKWLDFKKILHIHVPNGKNRPKKTVIRNGAIITFCSEGARLKRMGQKRGFPDFIIFVQNRYHAGLIIEMKKKEGGAISPEQQAWIENLIDHGYCAVVCRGWDEAKDITEKYLTQRKTRLETIDCSKSVI